MKLSFEKYRLPKESMRCEYIIKFSVKNAEMSVRVPTPFEEFQGSLIIKQIITTSN